MEKQDRGQKWTERMYARLFGETKWKQEKRLKRLLIITAILAVLAVIGLMEDPRMTAVMLLINFLVWSWSFISATSRNVSNIISFFDNDMAIFVFTILCWLIFGTIVGAMMFILGIIRFVQIKRG